jgi:peptide deformylase
MSAHQVLKYGDPRLLERSQEVADFDSVGLHQLIVDLRDTMKAYEGAGIAAPQIGVLQRVVIFGSDDLGHENSRYPDSESIPDTVLINPEIEILTQDCDGMWEGCLSVPGMRGYVERPNHIRYSGYDQFGQKFERDVTGFHAIVVQHECDHLDGLLYPMKIKDMSLFGFEQELTEHQS